MVQIALIQNDLYSRLGIVPSKSILVTGSTGVGKSHLINAVLSSARIQSFRVNALSLALWLYKMDQLGNSITDDTMCPLRKAINRARSSSPAVVILEDLHIVSDDLAGVEVDFGLCISRISSEIKRMADDSCVIATCRETEKLPVAFKRRGPDAIFQTQIMLEVPSSSTRKSIAKELLTAASYLLDSSDPSIANLKGDAVHQYSHRIAEVTPGFVARDIKNLITRASAHARLRRMNDTNLENITEQLQELKLSSSNNFPPLSWSQDFLKVLNCINASQAVDTGFDMSKTDLKWENIGGYEKVKSKLKTLVINPFENPQAYQRLKVKPPSGILLYGPSGCGKTLLAKTLGSNSPMNFISVNGNKIFSKYLGESEATVRRIFELARKLAPCIIFFDEIDILGVRREWSEDGASGVNERVLSTLLNEMDGVAEQKGVIVIGSTNRPEKLDDALLRPGRLDQHIYVPMPSHEDRAAILDSLLSRITSNVDVTRVANVTDGLSPADLVVLIREAKYLLMRGNDPDLAVLEWKHIAAALSGALKGPLTEAFV
ncbi:AAA-domain-containing protein [Rhizoclosmatium globosum]|uniref:AAA-domain-containing protein n=1 Tax=Rhizoclosmatium globosum TaxID=329046 RepID=A0A1Y2CV14_9FUNG|nr:AAA-domain-containing protein [Rhizoclosmatium globosum]|eukprot:ORY50853.1 AAA-domain-containing protein [Rhizoclosmatium globosum]